jgi:peptidoglycan-associated lipoprotein
MAVLVFFISNLGIAQQNQNKKPVPRKATQKADEAYEAGEYAKAAEKYMQTMGKVKDRKEKTAILFRIGECYRFVNQPKKAENWYKRAIATKIADPLAVYYYADMMKMQDKIEDAKKQYEEYQKLVPTDPRGAEGIKSCDLITSSKTKPSRYKVSIKKEFSSKQSDFGLAYYKDTVNVYFTSSRDAAMGNNMNYVAGMGATDIFYAKKDRKDKWSLPVPLPVPVSTVRDEGMPWINKEGTVMYYTYCPVEKKKTTTCKIMQTNRQGEAWAIPTEVVIPGDSDITIGAPSLTEDELTMYFTSDQKGGQGGRDIWKTTRSSKSSAWTKAVNVGKPINTTGDELFAFIRSNGDLYFSSNGHPGLGGLDIFRYYKDEDGNMQLENLKYPINSVGDDFGITFYQDKDLGYFCSSRPEGVGMDDIYSFYWPDYVFTLKGIVKEEGSGMPLDADVKLMASDGTTVEYKSKTDGIFRFVLKPNTDYRVLTTKENYLNGTGKESTRGLKDDAELTMEIFMTPTAKPIELPNILYDFNKADLRPESTVSLDKLVTTLNENPAIVIELAAHTDFRGSDKDNQDLSQRRAQSVVNYLISKGIDTARLVAKGYGEKVPKTVDKTMAEKFAFLKLGDVLNEEFITKLTVEEEKETCHQINRRTEFSVLSKDFVKPTYYFGGDENNVKKEEKKEEKKEDLKEKQK